MDVFWPFSRHIVTSGSWASLNSRSSKCVLPTIMRHCDKDGKAFPNEDTLAIKSGVDTKTVKRAIKELVKHQLMSVEVTFDPRKMRRKNQYQIGRPGQGHFFPFFPYLVDSGLWASLPPSAKNLYIVLRCGAHLSEDDYLAIHAEMWSREEQFFGEAALDTGTFIRNFAWREWELFTGELDVVKGFCGIKDTRTLNTGLAALEDAGLVLPVTLGGKPHLRVQVEEPVPMHHAQHQPLQ